jgi:hypothetical protein
MVNIGDEVTAALPLWAEYTVRVKVTEDMVGEDGEVDYDLVLDEVYSQIPSGLCHHCSTGNSGAGWSERSPVYLELSEDPEVLYILGPDDKPVWGDPGKKTDL